MGILAEALRGEPRAGVTWSPFDQRWYTADYGGLQSDAGIAVSAETIFRCGTVLAAVRFKGDSVAVCPPQVFDRLGGGGRKPTPDHYAQRLLRNPNAWQTGFEWAHINVVWLSTWGNAYNRIVPSNSSFAGELRPMHPSRVRVVDQASDGSLVYKYNPLQGGEQILGHDEVHHYRGLSLDGMSGAVMYQLIRNAVGIALAAEKHAAVFLRKGSRVAGLLVPATTTTPEQRKDLRDSWNQSFGGAENTGTAAILPYGVDFKPIATDNVKAQFLELRDFQVGEILRFLGVPGVVVGFADKTATYASADAFFEKGGIKHCILPLVMSMEQRDEKALLLEGDSHFIKRNLDVLQRANTTERIATLTKAAGGPFWTRNEARAIEDMNPDPDPDMDKVLSPGNMAPTGEDPPAPALPPGPPRPAPKPGPTDDTSTAVTGRARQFVLDAAARVVRREVAAIRGAKGSVGSAARYAKDPAGFKAWVTSFYDTHAGFVAESMHLGEEASRAYAQRQRDELLATGGLEAAQSWEETVPARLAALAMGD